MKNPDHIKIVLRKNKTDFHIPSYLELDFKDKLSQIMEEQRIEYHLNGIDEYFWMTIGLSKHFRQVLIDFLYQKEKSMGKRNFICGFRGNLITGEQLVWL
jgi:hypothetical protein